MQKMGSYYILEGKEPKETDLMTWAKFMETGNKEVEKTKVNDVLVSTVFLGLDHSFNGGKPILFETMIFGGDHDQYQERYSTWDEAVEGHKAALKLVQQ